MSAVGVYCGSTSHLHDMIYLHDMKFVDGHFAAFFCEEDARPLSGLWGAFGRFGRVSVEMI